MIPKLPIFIRRATLSDALAITQIHQSAYKISYRNYIPDEYLDSLAINSDAIRQTQEYLAKNECYVAMIQNKIAGFLYVSYPEDKVFEIQALYVHPKSQKQGLGSALVKNLWETKSKKEYNKCVVWTMKFGPSLEFYKKMGFSPTTTEKCWKFNIPIIMLEKHLS